jgi:hypothetical protein
VDDLQRETTPSPCPKRPRIYSDSPGQVRAGSVANEHATPDTTGVAKSRDQLDVATSQSSADDRSRSESLVEEHKSLEDQLIFPTMPEQIQMEASTLNLNGFPESANCTPFQRTSGRRFHLF